MCRAIGPAPICLEFQVAKRVSHPRDPVHRRRGCRGLAAGTRGRYGRSHAVPSCAPGPRLQSDFSADLYAANLILCDPISCCMPCKRAAKKIRGRGAKDRVLCATPQAPIYYISDPKPPSESHTPLARFTGGVDAIASPRVPAATAAALTPSGRAHPAQR